jgi:hypothetical protein
LDVSKLPRGLYYLGLALNGTGTTHKLIKK